MTKFQRSAFAMQKAWSVARTAQEMGAPDQYNEFKQIERYAAEALKALGYERHGFGWAIPICEETKP